MSGILHVADAIGERRNWKTPITPETVELAAAIGRDYLLPHAKAAFAIMGADERVSKAIDVWQSIVRRSEYSECSESAPPSVTRRDLHQWNRRTFPCSEDLDSALNVLTSYGYLRLQEGTGSAGRGKKSPAYSINPIALEDSRRNMDPRTHCTHCTHSDTETDGSECSENSESAPPNLEEDETPSEEPFETPFDEVL